MRTRHDSDQWTTEGAKILSKENLVSIEAALKIGPIILQHWLYRGASSPRYCCFEDLEDFREYLTEKAVPGDAFDVWSFEALCNSGNRIAQGKLADTDGSVPKYGAY